MPALGYFYDFSSIISSFWGSDGLFEAQVGANHVIRKFLQDDIEYSSLYGIATGQLCDFKRQGGITRPEMMFKVKRFTKIQKNSYWTRKLRSLTTKIAIGSRVLNIKPPRIQSL